MPTHGKNGYWAGGKAPPDGNGQFTFRVPAELPDGLGTVESITFKNGSPDFDKYVKGERSQLWQVTGDAKADGRELMRVKRETDPGWTAPNKDDYVLHHFEDGSVGYVPRSLHDKAEGGAAHTGANSMINNDLF